MEKRFLRESGLEVFTGNEVLLKGGLESRMALLTGYPGSPVSDVFETVFSQREMLKAHGILAQISNNEGLAAARLNGARLANLRALAIFKSVGFHVAADGLAIGNLVEPNHPDGGCLIVTGDDPWNDTTQINSDSRFLSQHLNMPILEPSTLQEIKDWMDAGFEISGQANLYLTYVVTTNQVDGGGTVQVRPNWYPTVNTGSKTTLSSGDLPIRDFVMIPPHTSQKEATLRKRFQKFIELVRARGLNRQLYCGPSSAKRPLGFIVSGISYCYLEHALYEMGLKGAFPILKIGATYPLDGEITLDFLKKVGTAVVIEEKRPFLENQVRTVLQEELQKSEGRKEYAQVFGKDFPMGLPGIPEMRGINVSILIELLGNLLLKLDIPEVRDRRSRIEAELAVVRATAQGGKSVPPRTPTFCPGCPHRDSAVNACSIKKELAAGSGMDVIFHGESGCHSMLQFAPFEGLMQDYSGMGLGGGTGAGIDPFVNNKQVVFLGDSTFFHSGMVAISDSIKNNQNITYVILNNSTTAMTGHQPTPGNDYDILGRKTTAQDIEQIVRGMTGGEKIPVVRADPSEYESYRKLLESTILAKGVKVVIADKECGLVAQRKKRREKKETLRKNGFLPKEEFINITPEVCEDCLECTNATGCPGLSMEETDFGTKIGTDLSVCVGDGSCYKGEVCPSFEKVTVRRKSRPQKKASEENRAELPLPKMAEFDDAYYISTFGVGGMGLGVISAILVRAGMNEKYRVSFLDKKGLAVRNGGVYGHVIYSRMEDQVLSPVVPYGKADVILGMDILETARGVDPSYPMRVASPGHTHAVVNTHKNQTVLSLMGRQNFDTKELEESVRARVAKDAFFGLDFSGISQKLLGSKLYANIVMIGAAFQKGLIPISLENLEKAIRDTIQSQDMEDDLKAFRLGREVALDPEKFRREVQPKRPTAAELIEQKAELLLGRSFTGKKAARAYKKIIENALRWMHLGDAANGKIALCTYELMQYGDAKLAERYLGLLWDVFRKDRPEKKYAATRAVADNLFKVLAVKDEVYVAHLLTSKEKFARDIERFKIDRGAGDRITYVHLTRPQFSFWGLHFTFSFKTSNWMLRIMKHCKFLRDLLPGWHAREKEFADWYTGLVERFNYFSNDEVYQKYVEALSVPEAVKGYRELRYPKMDQARLKAESLLGGIDPGANRSEVPKPVQI